MVKRTILSSAISISRVFNEFCKAKKLNSSEALACVPSASYSNGSCENLSLVLTKRDCHLFFSKKRNT